MQKPQYSLDIEKWQCWQNGRARGARKLPRRAVEKLSFVSGYRFSDAVRTVEKLSFVSDIALAML